MKNKMNDVDQIIVEATHTLKYALEALDQSGMSILLLIDANGVLQQTITDGDIRRLLLAGNSLEDRLVVLEPASPIVADDSTTIEGILTLMDTHEITQVPVVNAANQPVGLYLRHEIQPRIQLSIPHMGGLERKYVEDAFDTNWLAPLGPNVDAFESEMVQHVGSKHGAALSSGTAAIHLALRLLDIGSGDVVFCSSFTFVASANPIMYQAATPVFIDSEPATWNMSPAALEKGLQKYESMGQKPKAIIVAHLYGQSADMKSIMALSELYGVPVIEDAAESLGASYQGQPTGTFGLFGVFSFNGNKIITTTGGGMLISDDEELIEKARFLSTQARDQAPHYEHTVVGYNYRMSNVLAGIGRGQLQVLDDRVESRREIFNRYHSCLQDLEWLDWMPEPEGDYSNRWLSVLSINPKKTNIKPTDLISALGKINIEARHVWKPMHRQPLFAGCDYFRHGESSYCDFLFDTGVCMPSASNMTTEQQMYVIRSISKYARLVKS
ncbi:MAG: dTDP-4-amino-4,6-dideoxygalactose transaminase [Paraglaciecola sp.]|jgi:dTDP-4-amino-4,6-dideoxygalactose transaminase